LLFSAGLMKEDKVRIKGKKEKIKNPLLDK
jgi:hypothetical protein